MEWDLVSFLPEVQDYILPEFKRLEWVGATNVALSPLQSLVTHTMDNSLFYHNIHFAFNTIAIVTSMALFALGCHRCQMIHRERRRL
jgi:hypothetical protein